MWERKTTNWMIKRDLHKLLHPNIDVTYDFITDDQGVVRDAFCLSSGWDRWLCLGQDDLIIRCAMEKRASKYFKQWCGHAFFFAFVRLLAVQKNQMMKKQQKSAKE